MATTRILTISPPGIARIWSVIGGVSLIEAVAGIGAVVLPILGLIGVMPMTSAIIAALVIGVGLFLEGAGLISRYRAMHASLHGRDWAAIGSGMAIEFLGGAAGIVLAAIALAGTSSITLTEVACIVEGATLFLGSGAVAELNTLGLSRAGVQPEVTAHASRSLTSASGLQAVVGLAGIILAILAMLNHWQGTVTTVLLIATLCMGTSLFFSGAAVCAKASRERERLQPPA